MIFNKRKHKDHNLPIKWGNTTLEIKDNWKYLGVTLNRLTSPLNHIKKIKNIIANKQTTLINHLASKRMNSLNIHIKLFNSLVRSAYMYAAPAWMWKNPDLIESIQTQYFRRIFLLPFKTPSYIIQAELGLQPMIFTLIKSTFQFWKKLATKKAPYYAWKELKYWLLHPNNKDNPWKLFFQKIKIPPSLTHITMEKWKTEQIELAKEYTITLLSEEQTSNLRIKALHSWYHPHYNSITNISNNPQPYLQQPWPWAIKRLIFQLRTDPNDIYLCSVQIILDSAKPCHLCNQANQTIDHLLLNCCTIQQKFKYPPRLPITNLNHSPLQEILKNPTEQQIWYIRNILKLIILTVYSEEEETSSSN